MPNTETAADPIHSCLLYTSDAADEDGGMTLGGM